MNPLNASAPPEAVGQVKEHPAPAPSREPKNEPLGDDMTVPSSSAPAKPKDLSNLSDAEVSRMCNAVFHMVESSDKVKALTDAQLSQAVLEKVWGQVVLGSEQDWLLDELITRFDAAKGIKRGDNGEVIPATTEPAAMKGTTP